MQQEQQAAAAQKAEQEAALVEAEVAIMVRASQDGSLDIIEDEAVLEKKKSDVLQKVNQQWLLQIKAWCSKNHAKVVKAVNGAEEIWVKRMDALVV